jgi:hypothetical protein
MEWPEKLPPPPCPMALLSIQDLRPLNAQIPGVSVPVYVLQPLQSIFFRSFSTLSNHFFLGFPVELFPSGIFLDLFFQIFFSPDILSTCPNHRSVPFLIYEIIFVSYYRSIESCLARILRTPFEKLSHASLFRWSKNEWMDLSVWYTVIQNEELNALNMAPSVVLVVHVTSRHVTIDSTCSLVDENKSMQSFGCGKIWMEDMWKVGGNVAGSWSCVFCSI